MREYEVGDIVRINPNIRMSERGVHVTSEMAEYAGRKAEVKRSVITSTDKEGTGYRLNIDNELCKWQAFMFDQTFKEEMNEEVISAYFELFEGSERRNV